MRARLDFHLKCAREKEREGVAARDREEGRDTANTQLNSRSGQTVNLLVRVSLVAAEAPIPSQLLAPVPHRRTKLYAAEPREPRAAGCCVRSYGVDALSLSLSLSLSLARSFAPVLHRTFVTFTFGPDLYLSRALLFPRRVNISAKILRA